ncbi:RAB11-binding protein RELCH homolog isoform X2 [Aethina tumida]|uniref:RAB11-binding protein RELCH homolog isoform X2 n=1 Tax=Aethina tumida TaxID=116153 RepID=UPI0021479C70|nr:RAB11-binding protein RELCH homolog isoform X2 [Aethina tumida]
MSVTSASGDIKSQPQQITYNDIASKLIQDRLLLTALELHTELVESGRELKQLKDFFSNPGNFELQTQEIPTRISRSGSQATLDSLDLTRFSEFGDSIDEKVAVLEFELRKAKETINALRNNLTVATESENSTPDKGSLRNLLSGTIKPHEQRALNFLINEYLLLHGYKLTSITFADENPNQDFDDWDDVGLNISKPPELYNLYREGLKQTGQNCVSIQCQTDNQLYNEEVNKAKKLEDEMQNLKAKLSNTENECSNLKTQNLNLQKENDLLSSSITNEDLAMIPKKPPSKGSMGSESPERFEMIDKKSDSIIMLEDNISNNSFNTNEWTNLCINENKDCEFPKDAKNVADLSMYCKDPFLKEVFSLSYVSLPQKVDNESLENILNDTITTDTLVHTLSDSLLKIIPNIILNKREEVIPLLIKTVHLNPKASERDKLLQQLFNLKKKPTATERQMILSGLVAIAKCSGQSLVENEILPQCWLQLTHKHFERRVLVAEACCSLIPYVSSPIRNSLILSMLQQMLDDKEEAVRETVIKALSLLFSLCEDSDKYTQCEQLALSTLNDPSSIIVNLSTQILFPVLGKWAFREGLLSSSLLKHLLHKFNVYLKGTESPTKVSQSSDKILRIVNVLENLLPFLLMSIALKDSILSNIEKGMALEMRPDFAKLCTNLTNPEVFYKSEINCGMIIYEFDKYMADHSNETWKELDWVLDIMIPDLLNNLSHIDINQQALLHSFMNLISHICIIFGKNFTKAKIRPLLDVQIKNLEQIISSFNQFCPSLNIIPVYLVSVLSYCDDHEELSNILKKFLCALPLCGTPLDCLVVTVRRLCEADLQEIVVSSLWEGVVHQRPLVRSAAATLFSDIVGMCDQNLLNQKVTPALL